MTFTNFSSQALIDFSNSHNMCKRCIGRVFGRQRFEGRDYTIVKAEEVIKQLNLQYVSSNKCELCAGIVEKALELVPNLVSHLESYEFETFLFGVSLNAHLEKSEKLYQDSNFTILSYKHEIAREVGLRFQEVSSASASFDDPEINILLDIRNSTKIRYKFSIKPLYILGKYLKFSRVLPQTKWPCGKCRGRKCEKCEYTGLQYRLSVEQIVAKPFLQATQANDESFHGAGREDIDALMLGEGRPFVLELKNPKRRQIDLEVLMSEVNQSEDVQINQLRFTEKITIAQIKESSPNAKKKYLATTKFDQPLDPEAIKLINKLGSTSIVLHQRTPTRVSHRRADIVRTKHIYEVSVHDEKIDTNTIKLIINAEGGAYIKEFISGDDGRTDPSISSLLENPARCVALDVLEVDDKGLF